MNLLYKQFKIFGYYVKNLDKKNWSEEITGEKNIDKDTTPFFFCSREGVQWLFIYPKVVLVL